MKKKIISQTFLWLSTATGLAILLFAAGLLGKGSTKRLAPRPDVIATSTSANGSIVIKDKTAGYAISVPERWHLEKGAGSGVVVYPYYGAADKALPGCKIEISTLPNPNREDLGSWLAAYLRSDPTADISEILRATTTIGGIAAVLWNGTMNGIPSVLAYVATGTDVYEIAPSSIALGVSEPADARCKSAFENVLKSFRIEP